MRHPLIKLIAALALACSVVSCADDDDPPDSPNPTAPSPPTVPAPSQRANLIPFGNFRWADCVSSVTPSCTFVAALRNVGTGCAIRVEGTVRFFNSLGFQLGGSYRFVLPPQQIVGVGENVPYFVSFVPVFSGQSVSDYTVTPVWIDTPCN